MANILKYSFILVLWLIQIEAKNLGCHGHVYPILEENLLEALKMKTQSMSNSELEKLNKDLQEKYTSKFRRPHPIKQLGTATSYRVSYVDPTICADKDIRNQEGQIIVKKGVCFNPLENIYHLDALLFFDAENPDQLNWARSQNKLVKWVFTNGSPQECEEKEEFSVYFDQFGILIKKFGVENLPAKVSRDGLQLKIEEIPVKRSQ